MYPTFSDLLRDLFGINIQLPVQTFGLMLAISFLLAAWTLTIELKRKEQQGFFSPVSVKHLVGEKASAAELLSSFLIGFIIGYKLLFIAANYNYFVTDTQGVLLSLKGSLPGGLIAGALIAFFKYREKEKSRLETPEWKTEKIPVHQLVGNITMVAAVAGLIGAKIFHNLENLDDFEKDPMDALLSFSGLTMYGGLIVGGIALLIYTRKQGMSSLHFMDAVAPGLMLAYGSGRIGCQLAGDGDWGIPNLAPKPDWMHFIPDWMWSFRFPHNVINAGIPIPGCEGHHCMMLQEPVFPTPFYESVICISLFFVLWGMRKRITVPGMLFFVYLIMNGVERFFIEKIRVNNQYHIFGHGITQAEIISFLLIITGVTGAIILYRKHAGRS
ncbi:MAG TPA: prolipoprotein diacylglyceryl transferase family protein [Bacteroidia bacterium]|nr:prolipoprotein diacylglyceryl transferase family protein [Bacteroidia bacterium]